MPEGEARIEFKQGRGPWELWAIRVGTVVAITESARGLLKDLKEETPRSQVRIVNGRGARRVRL